MADALKIALILTAVDKASSIIDKSTKKMAASFSKLDGAKNFLSKYGNYASIAGGIATASFIPAIHAAEENEVAVKRLEQVYRSMGQNVEQASKQNQAYASQLEMMIGVEDEAIMAVQTKLATFSKLSNETNRLNGYFDRATKLAFDMQATGFGDAAGNAVQLGKALQDPVKGITALRRAGITFSEAEKKRIALLVASNKITAAQEVILKGIEKQVGGVAEATTTDTAKAKVAWSEVTESMGKALLPTFNKIIDRVNEYIPRVQQWVENHSTLVANIAIVSTAVLGLGIVMKALSFGIGAIQTVISAVSTATKFLLANPIVLIIAAIAAAAYLIYDNWEAIAQWFSDLWDKVKRAFQAAWEWIKKMFLNYTPLGLVIKHWDAIVGFFQDLWSDVKQRFNNFIDFLLSLPGKLWDIGKSFIMSIWDGMKSVWNDLMNWFSDAWDTIKQPFEFLFGGSNEVTQKTMNSVYNTTSANPVLAPAAAVAPSYNSYSKGSTTMHFSPVITLNGGATQADAEMITAATQKQFERSMRKYNDNQERIGFK